MTKFIGLAGKKQTGKSVSSDIIKTFLEREDKRVAITAFADPLKKMCIEILGLQEQNVYGTNEQKNSLCHIMWDGLPNHIRMKYSNANIEKEYDVGDSYYNSPSMVKKITSQLPRSGNMTNREVLQVIGTDIFRALYGDVWSLAPFNKNWANYDYVLFNDVRFPNESKTIEDHNGIVIRLERETGLKDEHESEIALDNFEFRYKYKNNGTLEELEDYLWKTISH